MDTGFDSIFALISDSLIRETQRVAGYTSATPFHLLTSVRGLPVREEAHLVHTIASALETKGYQPFIEEPYAITHPKGKIKRCDFKIALDHRDDQVFQFLTFEVKHYLDLDQSFRSIARNRVKNNLFLWF